MTLSIKALLGKLDPEATRAMQSAAGLCVRLGHAQVLPEHLLRELAEADGSQGEALLAALLAASGIQTAALRAALERHLAGLPAGHSGKPVFSASLLDLLRDAWLAASIQLGEGQVRPCALLLAVLDRLPFCPPESHWELLRPLSRERLLELLPAPPAEGAGGGGGSPGFLQRFCVDLTAKAREGRIDPVFGRDAEIRQVVDILARRRKNNPICVGDPGVGKTAVVEGLALRIVRGEVPGLLADVSLLALDLGLLEAGAGMKGEFETRLRGVMDEIKASSRPVILFVDEAHALVGAGGAPGGGDAANLLKPALARGELRTIAATTWTEYRKYFEKDPALARRFQLVRLHPPTVDATVEILRGLRPHYEGAHGVIIREEALAAAAQISDRHLPGRFLPDKAIDLLDTACARIRVNLSARPPQVEERASRLRAMELEKAGLERDREHGLAVGSGRLEALELELRGLREGLETLEARWVREQEAVLDLLELQDREDGGTEALGPLREAARARLEALGEGDRLLHHEVDADVVAQVVSDWTGIPLGRLLRDEAGGLLALEERLRARIHGQDEALEVLARGIRAAKAGLRDPRQPMGVFLLAGPSGTGKTETALALAETLFGSEKSLISINLSEFQEGHSVSRLVGSPPGYVGYGEGGLLTEAVRQRPYSVVLLDEAEKAHGEVLNLFYQVFDKGVLTDGEGREIDFRNTVILLTSNLGAELIQEAAASGAGPREVLEELRPLLSRRLKPAFLARMVVVPFLPLGQDSLRRILAGKLERIRSGLRERNRIQFTCPEGLLDLMASRCACHEMGARGLEAFLGEELMPRLSRAVLEYMESGIHGDLILEARPDGGIAFAGGA